MSDERNDKSQQCNCCGKVFNPSDGGGFWFRTTEDDSEQVALCEPCQDDYAASSPGYSGALDNGDVIGPIEFDLLDAWTKRAKAEDAKVAVMPDKLPNASMAGTLIGISRMVGQYQIEMQNRDYGPEASGLCEQIQTAIRRGLKGHSFFDEGADEGEAELLAVARHMRDQWSKGNLTEAIQRLGAAIDALEDECSDCCTPVPADAPYHASPCGTYCENCMQEHAKECPVCSEEFDL